MRQDRLARPHHVRRIRIVADQLEGEVGLDARADVEVAAGIERPAAVVGLSGPKIDRDPALKLGIDLVEEMLEQHVLRGDGRIGLELEDPVPVGLLALLEPAAGFLDHLGELLARRSEEIEAPREIGRSPGIGDGFPETGFLRHLHHFTPALRVFVASVQSRTKARARQGNRMSQCVERRADCCPQASGRHQRGAIACARLCG